MTGLFLVLQKRRGRVSDAEGESALGEAGGSPWAWPFCLRSCPWCLLRLSLGMATTETLLLLLYVLRASASECAAFFLVT